LSDFIGILNYGMGNLKSVYNAVYNLGFDPIYVESAEDFERISHLIIPGVGHFQAAMNNLSQLGFLRPIDKFVADGYPLLGICLGMQLLATHSEEGDCAGLGYIPGQVREFDNQQYRVPHIGWNNVHQQTESKLFSGVKENVDFYFVHSFHFEPDCSSNSMATTEYGGGFVSAVKNNNVVGYQFHPEKSQSSGLQLIENFLDWDGKC
jgi:glutamine amidotransferase